MQTRAEMRVLDGSQMHWTQGIGVAICLLLTDRNA